MELSRRVDPSCRSELPDRTEQPSRSKPAASVSSPVGVVLGTGVVSERPDGRRSAQTVVVGAQSVTRPCRSFGSHSSVTYGCLPAGNNRAASQACWQELRRLDVVYEQLHALGRLFSQADARKVSPLNGQCVISVQSSCSIRQLCSCMRSKNTQVSNRNGAAGHFQQWECILFYLICVSNKTDTFRKRRF